MKLKKQFDEFYDNIRIQEESQNLKDKREVLQYNISEKFPDEMEKHNILLKKSDIEMFDQGSYKYNTTIRAKVIDRDVAIIIPLNIEENPDPRTIKTYLYNVLNSIFKRYVSFKEPCITVSYIEAGEEWMHIDLPLYAKFNSNFYLARGKKSGVYLWEPANPRGLNEDLCNMINGNDQLRRTIRFIKKWRNEKYINSTLDYEIPPSIGLTYLACDCFPLATSVDGNDDLLLLKLTMEAILAKFVTTYEDDILIKADITRILTVQPYTDIFYQMKKRSDNYGVSFYNRLKSAVDNLRNALIVENEHDAGIYVQKVFGKEFVPPIKPTVTSLTEKKRDHCFG